MKYKLFNLLVLLSMFSLMIAAPATAKPATSVPIKDQAVITKITPVNLKNTIYTPDGKARVIVQLTGAPLALAQNAAAAQTAPSSAAGKVKLDATSAESAAYISQLAAVQSTLLQQLESIAPGTTVNYTYQVAFNGLSLAIDPNKVNQLAALPGVLKVYPDQIREAQMDASLSLIKADVIWAALGGKSSAGHGIKIADIDSGLRPANPMFSDAGFSMPAGYPKGFCATNPSDPTFQCNNKVIVARVFPDPFLSVAAEENIDNPIDVSGHGTHTAGTAAGKEVIVSAGTVVPVDTTISGVAPAAYLMVYKALFEKDDHSGSYGSDSSLIAALNAALTDGADIINNSWGGGPGGDPNANVEKAVIDAITAAGTLVVFAAGNDGPGSTTIGCPGCVENALTVAASTSSRIFANRVEITGPGTVTTNLTNIASLQGTGPKLAADLAKPLRYISSNNDGCLSFASGALSGSVALIQRGNCAFSIKVNNAAAAGAAGVLVFNHVAGPPSSMSSLETTTIPSVMISLDDGNLVKSWVTAHPIDATIKIYPATLRSTNNAWQDILAGFSSAGPNGDPGFLKPDITAPGVNILSAFSPVLSSGSDPAYALLQGTSMAAPHITGAGALLMQLHPTWTPAQVKTVLTSTAVQSLVKPDGVTAADPFNMGSGRVDLDRASHAGLAFDKPSFASGNCVVSCTWTRTITNVGATTETWTADITVPAEMGIVVSPTTFTLAPGLSGQFTVTVSSAGMPAGVYQFGNITWKTNPAHGYSDAYLPLAVKVGATTDASSLTNTVNMATNFDKGLQTYTLTIGNPYTASGKFFVSNPLPTHALYVAGSATGGLAYDTPTNTLNGSVTIPGLLANVAPTGTASVYSAHAPNPANGDIILNDYCTVTCDDIAVDYSYPEWYFYYMGKKYTTMGISSNGYLMVGGSTVETTANQLLPNPAAPNHVIAPLWTDLVMKGSLPGDTQSGIWFIWKSAPYTVFEWQNAQHFNEPNDQYTFQVWVEDYTSNITIAYGKLSSLATHSITVGMENSTGTAGSTYFYVSNSIPQGTAPAVGTDLAVNNNYSTATMTFMAKVDWDGSLPDYIYDIANLKNNLNVDEVNAAAKTSLLELKARIMVPMIRR